MSNLESSEKVIDQHRENALDPTFVNDVQTASESMKLRGRKLTATLSFVAGTGFILFGYDQGVMSALLTANQFEKVFPQVVVDAQHPNHATLQSFLVAIYEIGCLSGALLNLFVGDRFGRKKTIALGCAIMAIGAILQAASFSYAQMIVARIITGVGNGLNTSTVPAYHAECSPAHQRGSLIMIEGSLITLGIMISFWASGSSAQWRLYASFGFLTLNCSSAGLMKAGREAEAMATLEVQKTFHAVHEAMSLEGSTPGASEKTSLSELFTGGRSQNFRRVALGVVIQCFQQTILFERLGIDDVKSRILAACNGTEYFLASLVAIFLIDRIGRRKLMLFGAVGQCITMVLLAVLGSINNSAADVPAEIVGLRMRGPANALSTASNWIFNFLVVMITGPAFENISWGTYIVFAALNALLVPSVYFFFPETAGRSLEDMDVIFALAYLENVSPVAVSLRKDVPPAGSPEAERILGLQIPSNDEVCLEKLARENQGTNEIDDNILSHSKTVCRVLIWSGGILDNLSWSKEMTKAGWRPDHSN
ncbi:hypothetical protein BT96DRAFT_953007 [Gymnopus androsaceus JB14]|uniref:Major facilitator superfamily (MFS) profile domain-containing protein n=1 Tax=Gymnopus androsaceus JB14 TaxID=1447944 RepID=A0A6A4IPZ4_9AGAR|nr:hypothetical protein BT96DRAFT_953007 [Gymnopus androsaceus JB14]